MKNMDIKKLVSSCSVFIAVASLYILFSWLLFSGDSQIIQINQSWAPIQFNTALLMLLSSLAVFFNERVPRLTSLVMLFVALFSGLTLIEYLTGINLYIDQLFVASHIEAHTSHLGRMSPPTTLAFILFASAFLLWANKLRFHLLAGVLIQFSAVLVVVSLIEYGFGVSTTFAWGNRSKMSVATGVLFVLLHFSLFLMVFSSYKRLWRPYVYLSAFACILVGVSSWAAYFTHRSKVLNQEISLYGASFEQLFINEIHNRKNAFDRMFDRLESSESYYNSKTAQGDYQHYLKDYHDLDEIMVAKVKETDWKSSQYFSFKINEPPGIAWQKHTIENLKNDHQVMYYYRLSDQILMRFRIDLNSFVDWLLKDKNYAIKLSGKDKFYHFNGPESKEFKEWKYSHSFELNGSETVTLTALPNQNFHSHDQAFLSFLIMLLVFAFACFVAYVVDLSFSLNNKREKLQGLNTKLDTLVNTLPVGVFQTDARGSCMFVSQKWNEITGMNPRQAFGVGWHKTIHPEDRAMVLEAWSQVAVDKQNFNLRYRILRQQDQSVAWIQAYAQPVTEQGVASGGYIGCILDVTSEMNAKAELEAQKLIVMQSERMRALGQMAGGVAHEINNPLATIEAYVTLIRSVIGPQDLKNKEKLVQATHKISKTVHRISSIIQGLRIISRDGSNDELEEIRIKDLLDHTLSISTERIKKHGVELIIDESINQDIVLHCRETQISQVLVNLLNNALDAVSDHEKPWIKIWAKVSGEHIEINVSDSGKGIEPALQDKIMNPFFTTKDVGQGTGLGLSISSSIMKANNAELTYDNNETYTTFKLVFPAA